eukprot:4678714-Amphidinium_carterae.1
MNSFQKGLLAHWSRLCSVPTLSCNLLQAELKDLAQKVIELAECHGLDVSQFGGKECKSGKASYFALRC